MSASGFGNAVVPVASGDGWMEEKTGLHDAEFIETRRHWFSSAVSHRTNGGVQVLNLIEGRAAVVESPVDAFEPFTVIMLKLSSFRLQSGNILSGPSMQGRVAQLSKPLYDLKQT